ncbi:hypothetical protein [Streptomyces sp. NBC_01262]|jgi:hypothetical protein|uniref:hypothetical protein n=1 Tax=Streptomyces sp. NBC_01262 TaxID=2903803 RepID=UPI002E30853B|nr:hypothetical protein [Streptomyces sp. NBC_01262]
MRREPGGPAFGRGETAEATHESDQEGLSTEDIAQTETTQDDDRTAARTTDRDRDDTSPPGPVPDDAAPLLEPKQADDLRLRWQEIQQGFVDDPQSSVRAADSLVAEVMQLLATTFADHKHGLEGQWHRGEEIVTEDLRIALRQYRSFFDRLLSA